MRAAVPRVGKTAALAAAVFSSSASATLDVQFALEHSRGLYGEATATTIESKTLTLRWRSPQWLAQIEVPQLTVRNAGGVAALPERDATAASTAERGVGDAWLRLGATLLEAADARPGVDLVLKLKAANASQTRGLGSGRRDWALQAEWFHRFDGITAFGEIGRRWTGDMPGARPLNDPWYAEIGFYLQPLPALELGLYHDGRERIGRLGPLHETTAYAAWRLGDHKLQLYATRGWTVASADRALGLNWRTRWH